mgnify:CR=1 FL=1
MPPVRRAVPDVLVDQPAETWFIDPVPQMVKEPRSNPYIFYREDEVPGGFERDIADYRKKHAR